MYSRAIEILKDYEDELDSFFNRMVKEVIFMRREMNRIKRSQYR